MKNELFEQNIGLVRFVANRWKRKNPRHEYDDLYQIGCVGLLKAAKGFEPKLGFKFATYAVPLIFREIQRHFRDHEQLLHVPRSTRELSRRILACQMQDCSSTEIADRFDCDIQAAKRGLMAANLDVLSLDCQAKSKYGYKDTSVMDTIPCYSDFSGPELNDMLGCLTEREREIVRYRLEGMLQAEIGEHMGCNQVCISRTLSKIKTKLERYMKAG